METRRRWPSYARDLAHISLPGAFLQRGIKRHTKDSDFGIGDTSVESGLGVGLLIRNSQLLLPRDEAT